jgi:DNA-binding NarL/FixJ family response regulator
VTGDDRPQSIRVLIAEDDTRVRAALRTFLATSPGIDVVGDAKSAATALEMARQRTPTVAVIDVCLPDPRDGLGLLRVMTRELHIPAIAISIQGGFRGRALAAGAYRFVDKDSPPELIVAALWAAVQGQQRNHGQ